MYNFGFPNVSTIFLLFFFQHGFKRCKKNTSATLNVPPTNNEVKSATIKINEPYVENSFMLSSSFLFEFIICAFMCTCVHYVMLFIPAY